MQLRLLAPRGVLCGTIAAARSKPMLAFFEAWVRTQVANPAVASCRQVNTMCPCWNGLCQRLLYKVCGAAGWWQEQPILEAAARMCCQQTSIYGMA